MSTAPCLPWADLLARARALQDEGRFGDVSELLSPRVTAALRTARGKRAGDAAGPPRRAADGNDDGNDVGAEGLLEALVMLAGAERDSGRFEPAARHARDALELAPDGSDAALRALETLGTVELYLRRLDAAAEALDEAVRLAAELHGTDSLDVLRTGHNRGLVDYLAGRHDVAWKRFEAILAACDGWLETPHRLRATTLTSAGLAAAAWGEHARAAELMERAARETRQLLPPDHPGIGRLWNNLGAVARERGELEHSERCFRRAIEVYRRAYEVPGDGGRLGSHPDLADGWVNLGNALQEQGRLEEALQACRHGLAAYDRLAPDAAGARHYALHGIANVLRDLGRFEEAEAHYREAAAARPAGSVLAGTVHLNWGRLEASGGRHQRALAHFDLCAEAFAGLHPAHRLPGQLAVDRARSLLGAGRPGAAVAEARRAHALLGTRQREAFAALSPAERVTLNDALREGFALGAALWRERAVPGDELADGWFAFKGSAVEAELGLRSALARLPEDRRELGTAVLEARRRYARALLGEDVGERDRDARREELEEVEEALARAVHAHAEPDRAGAAHAGARNASSPSWATAGGVAQVASSLPEGALLLDYALLGGRVLLFQVTRRGLVGVHDVGDAAALTAAAAALQRALARGAAGAVSGGALDGRAAAAELGGALLGPAERALDGARELLVAPDGPLHLLPFDVLELGGRRLLERLPLRVLPAPRHALGAATAAPGPLGPPVLFGDPAYRSRSTGAYRGAALLREAPAGFTGWLRGLELPRLPYSREEVERLAALLPGARLHVRADASEAALFELRSPRLLHLATHAFHYGGEDRGLHPLMRSFIGLAGAGTALRSGRHEGLVPALTAATLDLRGTRLVVLSGCATAGGTAQAGEGVAGLAQGFFAAGARGVLATLWRVRDDVAADVMERYYQRLAGGEEPGPALWRVKRELARDHAPHVWAPFVLQGASVALAGDGTAPGEEPGHA